VVKTTERHSIPPAERVEIVDALYRLGAGQDLHDRAMFDSAFSAKVMVDFTGPARRLGAIIPVFESRQAIGDTIFGTINNLDTTHTITNPRVIAFDGVRATLFALVEAQHLPHDDHSRHLLLKNIYTCGLSKQDERWLIDRMQIENVWPGRRRTRAGASRHVRARRP
jgi:SnoaL-like domain